MNIGEKIKKLRKERKLTLAKVAGEGLSVGMLSLIENGKAQPSMESLQYIASQLQIDVAELLQGDEQKELRSLLNEMLMLNQQRNHYNEKEVNATLHQQLEALKPYIEAGKLNGQSYEEIRLFEMYLNVKASLGEAPDVATYMELISKYEQIHVYSRIVTIYISLASYHFNKRAYCKALQTLLEGQPYLDQHSELINEMEQLDYYYILMIIYSALGDKANAEQCLATAINISKTKKIIYRLNDFYRYLFAQHSADGNAEKSSYYLRKIKALASVLEDPIDLVYIEFLELLYANLIEKDYEKVIQASITYHVELGEEFHQNIQHIVQAEHAYAYYFLGRYEEAIKTLTDYRIPSYLNHPLDLARCYRTFAVKALAHFALGDIENAKREILYAMDGVKDYEDLADKQFIVEAYERIMLGAG